MGEIFRKELKQILAKDAERDLIRKNMMTKIFIRLIEGAFVLMGISNLLFGQISGGMGLLIIVVLSEYLYHELSKD